MERHSRPDRPRRPLPEFLFRTMPRPCPYLDDRVERDLFAELAGLSARPAYDLLIQSGFRRSHSVAYRPDCPGCKACVPVRVVASEFAPGRTQRRLLKANADLTVNEQPPLINREQFRLFSAYLAGRHGDGEMVNMTMDDYRMMIEDSPVLTFLVEFRAPDDRLVGVCLTDQVADGLSAVYSFYDPAASRRSLGTYMVLWLIQRARELDLDHVYLGYWIAETRKMSYKIRFRPLEGFGEHGWQRLPAE